MVFPSGTSVLILGDASFKRQACTSCAVLVIYAAVAVFLQLATDDSARFSEHETEDAAIRYTSEL